MCIRDSYLERARRISSWEEVYPAVLGWRGQQGGGLNTKQRVVWMFDHAEPILGLSLMRPILDALRTRYPGIFCAWIGEEAVGSQISKMLKEGRTVLSLDFSGFDHSLGPELLNAARYVLKTWLANAHDRLDLVMDIMMHVGIVVPFQVWEDREGGMPSGTSLTNLVDTIINLIGCLYVAHRAGASILNVAALGDDAVLQLASEVDVQDVEGYFSELGLEVSTQKQWVSDSSVHFLQNLHLADAPDEGHHGIRSVYRSVNGMITYERIRRGWSKYCLLYTSPSPRDRTRSRMPSSA